MGYEAFKTASGELVLRKIAMAQPFTITAEGNRVNSPREIFLEAVRQEILEKT